MPIRSVFFPKIPVGLKSLVMNCLDQIDHCPDHQNEIGKSGYTVNQATLEQIFLSMTESQKSFDDSP